jgi:fructoselysine 6-kinase
LKTSDRKDTPVKLIAIGDNLVDKYLNLKRYYPGGNSLNFSVFAQRYGASAAFIGCIGDDLEGQHICRALEKERVDTSHCQIVNAPTRYAVVSLVDGDRAFLPGGNKATNRMLQIQAEDFEFIKQFEVIHTNINSYLEELLPELRKLGPKISFDYSDLFDQDYLDRTLPFVDHAFFSVSEKSADEIKAFQKRVAARGAESVMVTRGAKGAIFYYDNHYWSQGAVETKVIDTLGCGDSFLASFLVSFLCDQGIEKGLQKAAMDAAETCTYYGAFGYGVNY